MDIEKVAFHVIGAAIEVHRTLGPGLLESTYESCLCWELKYLGIDVLRQVDLPVSYKEYEVNAGYRIDMLVENSILLELKSVERLLPIHEAQILTYMKLSGKQLGFLLNFNVGLMRQGIRRFVL